jgi:quinoprotein dehydrogenase-associated probable ABC transporter substrate-binding protein
MSRAIVVGVVLLVLALVVHDRGAARAASPQRVLRVCADPANLPFSNQREQGFENRLAHLLADELHARLETTFWAERRGHIRMTLKAHRCDVILGIPAGSEMVLTTRPYYRSTYVFVTRRGAAVPPTSFDDARLRTWRVGVPLVGDDGANPPPVHALSARGIVDNLRGFHVYGEGRRDQDPPLALLDALARGELDVAIAWGPFAGWYARHPTVRAPLVITPVPAQDHGLDMTFAIALGVRKDDTALRDELDAALARRARDIDRLLDAYGVPR